MAMRDIGSRAPHLKAMGGPKALGSRRSGRAGEPAAVDLVGASASLDDVPQDPRLPSYPPVGPPVGPISMGHYQRHLVLTSRAEPLAPAPSPGLHKLTIPDTAPLGHQLPR